MKVERVREKDGKLELMAELTGEEVSKEMQRIAAYEMNMHDFKPNSKKETPVETVKRCLGAQEAAFVFDEGIMRHRTPFACTAAQVDVIGKPVFKCLEHAEEGKPFQYHMVCVPVPEFTLSSYDPVSIVIPSYDVKEDEIEEEIQKMRDASSVTVTDRSHDTVIKGDKVELTLDTTLDGEPFRPLCAEKRQYNTGALSMPDDFDDAIVGMSVGETKTFKFEGPELELDDEGNPIMKTYECTATVTRILGMKAPELGDEWARTTLPGVKNMADLRKKVAEKVREQHTDDYNRQAQTLAGNEIAKRLEGDIPDLIYGVALKEAQENLTSRLKEENTTLEEYLKKEGLEKDQLNQFLLMQVRGQLTRQFALNAYAKYKGMKVDDADLEAFFESIAPRRARQAQADFRNDGRMFAARCAALRLKASKELVAEADIKEPGTKTATK